MIEFKLPALGADMDEATLLEWNVQPGDVIKKGQVVAVVDTTGKVVGRHPNGSWASSRVTLSRLTPRSPQRRHHESSSLTRHANTARSGCSCWPVTSNPRSSRRQKVVRSARAKPARPVASGTSRSFG